MSEKSVKKLSSKNQTQLYKPRKGLTVHGSRRQGQNRKHKTVTVVYYKPANFAVLLTLKKGQKSKAMKHDIPTSGVASHKSW